MAFVHRFQKDLFGWLDPIDGTNNFVTQKEDFAVMVAYFEDGIGQFGLIYDVMRDYLFYGGGEFPVYRNEVELTLFVDQPLENFSDCVKCRYAWENDWGMADLGMDSLGIRVYGSAGISFSKILSGGILAYFSYIWPMGLCSRSDHGRTVRLYRPKSKWG